MLRGKQTGTLYGKDRAVKQAHYSHRSKRFPRTGCPDYGKRTPLCNGKVYIADKLFSAAAFTAGACCITCITRKSFAVPPTTVLSAGTVGCALQADGQMLNIKTSHVRLPD